MRARVGILVAALLGTLAGALPAQAATLPPEGMSSNKVLVLGLDGVRWDKLRGLMESGRAPNLASLASFGFAIPTLLPWGPPEASTISSVGWSSVASGVGPAKHGVTGPTNSDLDQAEKRGFSDFLTLLEELDSGYGTLLASDWGNIGGQLGGGPIFGYGIDVRRTFAARNTPDYERLDPRVTELSSTYLRDGDPDAAFVYLGLPDSVAHSSGSATPAYSTAISKTDANVGRILEAVRERPRFPYERWTVIVTTDHGQLDLAQPSAHSHGGSSEAERTSFVIAAGPGIERTTRGGILDIAPTVLHQLGAPADLAAGLDGRSFVIERPPPPPGRPVASARIADVEGRPSLALSVRRGRGNAKLQSVEMKLPRGLAVVRTRSGRRGRRLLLHARADSLAIPARRTLVAGPRSITTGTSRGRRRITVGLRPGAVELTRTLRRRLLRGERVRVRMTTLDATEEETNLRVRLRLRR